MMWLTLKLSVTVCGTVVRFLTWTVKMMVAPVDPMVMKFGLTTNGGEAGLLPLRMPRKMLASAGTTPVVIATTTATRVTNVLANRRGLIEARNCIPLPPTSYKDHP